MGLNEAGRQTGLDKKTLLRWARANDIDTQGVSLHVSEQHRVAAAARMASVANERAEARERVITRLLKTTELALARELEILVAGGFGPDDLQAITNSRMKAIQQFELLEGRVTDRQDYGAEAWIGGVAAAFGMVLAVLPEAMHSIAQETFARGLREVQEQGLKTLAAGTIEDAEIEDAELVGETEAT